MADAMAIGNNVKAIVNGNILTLTVDLSVAGNLSASGKSITLATTGAPTAIMPGIKVGLSVFKSK